MVIPDTVMVDTAGVMPASLQFKAKHVHLSKGCSVQIHNLLAANQTED